jgi:hypothetical protein
LLRPALPGFLAIGLLLLVACGSTSETGEGQGSPQPNETLDFSGSAVTVTALSTDEQAAVGAVLDAVAVTAGEQAAEATVLAVEAQEWPDGCLGLGAPDEACTLAIAPGYRIVIGPPGGLVFVYRTNFDGSVVRFEGTQLGGGGEESQD